MREITTTIKQCARCGEDHESITLLPFFRPIEIGPHVRTHWGLCPKRGEPIVAVPIRGDRVTDSKGIPTGTFRPCCHIGPDGPCTKPAEFTVYWGGAPDQYSEGCPAHVYGLADSEADPANVYISVIQ